MLIGLVGKAGSGKTTIANLLIRKYGFERMAFADPLKEMLIKAGMCTRDECYGEKTKMSRWLMQKVGTEIFREQIDEDFWVKATLDRLSERWDENPRARIVIDDVRMPNEAQAIRALGGELVRVVRIGYENENAAGHKTEMLLDTIQVDHEIHAVSGDIQGLLLQADAFAKSRGLFPKEEECTTK